MDVNKHERLSNITLRHKLKLINNTFYCCSTFHSHSRVFNNENNSYPIMSVKCLLVIVKQYTLYFPSINISIWASLSFWCHLVYKVLFPNTWLSTRKQILSSLYLTSYYKVTNIDKKQPCDCHQINSKKTRQFEIVCLVWLTGWSVYMI